MKNSSEQLSTLREWPRRYVWWGAQGLRPVLHCTRLPCDDHRFDKWVLSERVNKSEQQQQAQLNSNHICLLHPFAISTLLSALAQPNESFVTNYSLLCSVCTVSNWTQCYHQRLKVRKRQRRVVICWFTDCLANSNSSFPWRIAPVAWQPI